MSSTGWWTDSPVDHERFDDVHLGAGTIRARARQGGPLGGASASLVVEAAAGRHHRPSHRFAEVNGDQLFLVIEAPTWTLRRKVGPGRERAASLFAATVNIAATRAATSTWWPALASPTS